MNVTDRFGIIVWSAVNVKDNNFKNGAELQGYFTKGLEKILHQYGKELLGWDEILEGGVVSNATVMSWQGMTGGVEAAKLNHKVVMAPTDYCYLDYNQDDPFYEKPADGNLKLKTVYEFEPVPSGIDSTLILGGQGNLWSESVPHFRQVQYMLWPRSLAMSEVLWSPKNTRNWKDFIKRTHRYLKRFDLADQ